MSAGTNIDFLLDPPREPKRPTITSSSTAVSTLIEAITSAAQVPTTVSSTAQAIESVGTAANENIALVGIRNIPQERIYPHAFDSESPQGRARLYMLQAIQDGEVALEQFGVGNLEEAASRLSFIATAMWRSQELTRFNEAFGAVVSHVRRAMLITDPSAMSRASLNALCNVMKVAADNPLLDLDDATDQIELLASEGWMVEMPELRTFIAALVGEADSEYVEELQRVLFDNNAAEN